MPFEGVPSSAAPKFTHGKNKGMAKTFLGVEQVLELSYRWDPRIVYSKRKLNQNMKIANRTVMLHWHRVLRLKHFTKKGGTQYKYQRRTFYTNKIKREHFGHTIPLKQKGDAETITGTIKSLRVTKSMGNLVMRGPWYLGYRAKRKVGGLSPDLKSELTRIDMRDGKEMAELGSKILKSRYDKDMKARVGNKKKRVRTKVTPTPGTP